MIMSKMHKQFLGKKGIFVFSDPAGAKACLALATSLNQNEILVISNREYSFFSDFNVIVQAVSKKSIKSWIELFEPEFIFTGTSFPEKIELSFIKEAAAREIKTYSFVDHWINIKKRFLSNEAYIFPSEIWLIDEEAKSKALQEGLKEELLHISGNPYYDYLGKWKPILTKESVIESLGLCNHAEYILYAPEPISTFNLQEKYGYDELDGLKHIIYCLNEVGLSKTDIIIKGHPNQKSQIFLDYIKHTGNKNILYVQDFDINHLIYYSKVVIGYFSNSLIEATKMNKKVFRLLIDLSDLNLDPFKEMKIGKKIYDSIELNYELLNLYK